VRSIPRNLVAQTLRCNNGNLIADALVDFEVEGEFGVVSVISNHTNQKIPKEWIFGGREGIWGEGDVPLNNHLSALLDRLRANATHDCGIELEENGLGEEKGRVVGVVGFVGVVGRRRRRRRRKSVQWGFARLWCCGGPSSLSGGARLGSECVVRVVEERFSSWRQ